MSQGVQERKDNFSCLANYLNFSTSDISQDCVGLTNRLRKKIGDDLKDFILNAYNASAFSCEKIEEKLTLKKTSTSTSNVLKYEKICRNALKCFGCIKENLPNDDYEIAMLHAITSNLTIIEFRLWEYFQVSSRVKKLVNDANALRNKVFKDCKVKRKCL